MSNSGNRLMKLAASCNQLNQRDFPYDFVLYYYPVASEKESFSGTTQSMRKAVCDDLRGVTIDTKDAEDTVAKTVNELKQDMNLSKISNSKYLGLLAENPTDVTQASWQRPAIVMVLMFPMRMCWRRSSMQNRFGSR